MIYLNNKRLLTTSDVEIVVHAQEWFLGYVGLFQSTSVQFEAIIIDVLNWPSSNDTALGANDSHPREISSEWYPGVLPMSKFLFTSRKPEARVSLASETVKSVAARWYNGQLDLQG